MHMEGVALTSRCRELLRVAALHYRSGPRFENSNASFRGEQRSFIGERTANRGRFALQLFNGVIAAVRENPANAGGSVRD
jgi:hypothetical protein